MSPNSMFFSSQKNELSVGYERLPGVNLFYCDGSSEDARKNQQQSEDFLAYQFTQEDGLFSFIVCDGVGQSIDSGIAARLLGKSIILELPKIGSEKNKIENQNTLNAVMKEVLSKAEYSLGEMYEYVAQNLAFYDKASQTDTTDLFCNQIKNKVMADPNIQVNTCTTSNLSVTKSDEDTTIKYVIEFANYAITSISISDQEIQTAINEKLKNISTNEVNFTDIIGDIICYKKPQVSTTEWTDNAIIITEKIKNYLGITIDDIAEKSGRILIAFSVWRIKFIGNYNMTKNIIYPIYFKDVLLNNVPAKIMNFSLSLDDASKTDIYKFISSPSDYIKTISPESYLLYDKFISGE